MQTPQSKFPKIKPLSASIRIPPNPTTINSPSVVISNIFKIPWGNDPIWLAHIFQTGGSTTNYSHSYLNCKGSWLAILGIYHICFFPNKNQDLRPFCLREFPPNADLRQLFTQERVPRNHLGPLDCQVLGAHSMGYDPVTGGHWLLLFYPYGIHVWMVYLTYIWVDLKTYIRPSNHQIIGYWLLYYSY